MPTFQRKTHLSMHPLHKYFSFLILNVMIFTLAGCASTLVGGAAVGDTLPTGFEPSARIKETKSTVILVPRITPFDEISIKVFNVPSLSGNFDVNEFGNVNYPLLGELSVEGKSAREVSAMLEIGLVEGQYLKSPSVSIRLKKSTILDSQPTFTVEGSVNRPGVFELSGKTTLLRALAISGGLTDTANNKRILVVRETEEHRLAAAFDLGKLRNGETPDPLLAENDIIVVENSLMKKNYQEILRSLPLLGFFTIM